MRQASLVLTIATAGKGLTEITDQVRRWIGEQGFRDGLLTVFCQHTSASLLIQENADPDVKTDIKTYFEAIAPEGKGRYVHEAEGPDDMPAHLRAALTQVSLGIPVSEGKPSLGTWQGIYLFEHRKAPHRRSIMLHLIGE